MQEADARYALYYAPAVDSPLARFGAGILGYDAHQRSDIAFLPIPGFDETRHRDMTAEPRRYGFHGTLKAPFHLSQAFGEADLLAMAANFTAQQPAISGLSLEVTALGPFIALTPASGVGSLARLANAAVEAFEPFRAALTPEDIARRKPDRLSERQRQNLERWGYPHVFEDFRFHMTLTGSLQESYQAPMLAALRTLYAEAVPDPATSIDRIDVFRQDRRDLRFYVLRSFPLAAHLEAA